MGKKESEAAAALSRAKWKKKSPEERAAHAQMMAAKRWKDKTPEERSASAKKAAEARWAKAKRNKKPPISKA